MNINITTSIDFSFQILLEATISAPCGLDMASAASSMKKVSLSLSFFLSVSHTPTHRCVLMWLKAEPCWETDWCVMKCLTTDLAEQRQSRGALEEQLTVNHRTAVSPNALDGVRLGSVSTASLHQFSDPLLSDLKMLTGLSLQLRMGFFTDVLHCQLQSLRDRVLFLTAALLLIKQTWI